MLLSFLCLAGTWQIPSRVVCYIGGIWDVHLGGDIAECVCQWSVVDCPLLKGVEFYVGLFCSSHVLYGVMKYCS